ncbi:MAG: hypothetical protein Q8N30_02220 [Methylococcales bacterium]|jgi:hypothetical protein|nr:hypothetical protein [Methylococcales bacterium]
MRSVSTVLKTEVSGYAEENKTKIREFIAEFWAEYRNDLVPRIATRKVSDIVLKRYKDRRGVSGNNQ